jgi:protein-disulfide isomerase
MLILISLVLGLALVALAVYLVRNTATTSETPSPLRERSAYTYGSTRAPITIVEWSDAECPFCARVHPTLKRIVDESDGQVAWQYRHLPLPNHRMAKPAAVAAECVGEHVGNDAFWQYLDELFANQERITDTFLESSVTAAGVSPEAYTACQADSRIATLIASDEAAARHFGGSGTPFSLIIFPDNTIRPVRGALPYEDWQALLEQS